jgi:hypothetical protein
MDIVDDFHEIIPWSVGLDSLSYSDDLITELFLQLSKIVCLADRIGHNYINFRSIKSVRNVVSTSYGEWAARRYVWFWLWWKREPIGFSLRCHIAVRLAGSQARLSME